MRSIPFLSLAVLVCVSACGDDGASTSIDAGTPDAMTTEPDAACDPTTALPYAWRPIDDTSTGTITTTTTGDVITAEIDATAGGSTAAAENPYLYIDLATGTKVAITDWDSYSSSDWDLAFKRYVIRLNGGDSGPGGVETAVVFGATDLASVTAEPAANEFTTDDWATDDCDLNAGPLDEPYTAMSNWYAYEVGASMGVTPEPNVYVIRARDGALWKLRILTYYGGPSMAGGYFEVEWAPL